MGEKRESRSPWRRLALAGATAALCAALSTAASAQLPAEVGGPLNDPGPTLTKSTGLGDTVYTPVAKEPPEGLFKLISGPRYVAGESPSPERMVAGSRADFGADLLDVAFVADEDNENAVAVGNACQDTNGDGVPENACAETDRVPVIYTYTIAGGWQRTHLDDDPGYIASVAYFADGSAIAVGGSGRYPRREAGEDRGHCEGGRQPSTDPQDGGTARVWRFDGSSWRELRDLHGSDDGSAADEIPDTPASDGSKGPTPGFTAVDTYLPNPDKPIEFAIVGGLCQLWHWTEGGFWRKSASEWQSPFSPFGTAATKFNVPGLLYRVRQVSFVEPIEGLDPRHYRPRAYAAMSGCCADERLAIPAFLTYSTPADTTNDAEWCADKNFYICSGVGGPWKSIADGATAGSWTGGAPVGSTGGSDPTKKVVRVKDPDSFVAATARWLQKPDLFMGPIGPGVIATPTGPEPADGREPESDLGRERLLDVSGSTVLLDRRRSPGLSSVRLADGDGDRGGGGSLVGTGSGFGANVSLNPLGVPLTNIRVGTTANDATEWKIGGEYATGPDGVPDWSVGVLRSSGQAIAFSTNPTDLPPPDPALEPLPPRYGCASSAPNEISNTQAATEQASCLISSRTGEWTAAIQQDYDPTKATDPERAQRAAASYKLLKLPTYALNAIDFDDPDGLGFAVGDHGAIARLDAGRSASSSGALDPAPPRLGRRRPIEAPSRLDWAGRLPEATGSPGQVPPSHTASRTQLDHPELSIEGSTGPATKADEVIMRPDGGEGWAIGYGDGQNDQPMQLVHYDGARWTRCGDEGQEETPDPACESAIELAAQGIKLVGADRVPLELDPDPANDEELEIVAVSDRLILRYWNGRWRIDDASSIAAPRHNNEKGALDVAFAAPDDGLIVTGSWDPEYNPDATASQGQGLRQVFYRYDGERWRHCNRIVAPGAGGTPPTIVSDCDPHDRLPRGTATSDTQFGGYCGAGFANNGCVNRLFSAGERIYAVGIRRLRVGFGSCTGGVTACADQDAPMLTYRDRGEPWSASPAAGEIDPGVPGSSLSLRGEDFRFTGQPAVVRRPDGDYEGWAVLSRTLNVLGSPSLLRLSPGGGWQPFTDSGAHHFNSAANSGTRPSIAMRPGTGAASPALLAESDSSGGQLYELDPVRMRWRLVQTPFQPPGHPGAIAHGNSPPIGWQTLSDDHRGGFWGVTEQEGSYGSAHTTGLFYRYTDRPRVPLFDEVPQPSLTGARIKAVAGAPDGTLWAATPSNQLYRYDRALGWDRVQIPGWEQDRGVVTKRGAAFDIALGHDGSGLVVGEGGRIARIGADGAVELDPAAGAPCDRAVPVAPCGTTRDLLAVAIAPDGSAITAGTSRALLWRPAGGELRGVDPPSVAGSTSFSAAAMPQPGIVWLISSDSRLWRGELGSDQRWSWQRQTLPTGAGPPTKIALDAAERGYLITGRSTLFERAGDAWQRVVLPAEPGLSGLTLDSIALPLNGGPGALVGGGCGLLMTRWGDRFEVARHPDPACGGAGLPLLSTSISDLALVPGLTDGEAEAWALAPAGLGDQGTDRLFHYGSRRDDGLLTPSERAPALSDSPAPREGEVSLAAFGKSDCQMGFDFPCKPMAGMLEYTQVLTGRMIDEISARSRRPGGPSMALATGDAVDSGGHPGSEPAEEATGPATTDQIESGFEFAAGISGTGVFVRPSFYGSWRLRRWGELVADRLSDRGVAVLGAIGARDASDYDLCSLQNCSPTKRILTPPGENLAWRRAMALRSAPWGRAAVPENSRVKLRKLRGRGLDVRYEDQEVGSPAEGVPDRTAGIGGTDTSYAVDVFDPTGERKLARLVFVDNSSGALASSDPFQQPLRPDGQAVWLDSVLCFAGEISTGGRCTREPGQKAIVVANSPTYSYSVGVGSHTAADATAFETVLMKNRVNLAVAGRIGWNGLYWATAPGIHEPCPGSEYTTKPPSEDGAANVCGHTVAAGQSADQSLSLATALAGQGGEGPLGDVLDQVSGLTRTLPFVVASGAGGRFFGGQLANQGDARDGFWHGYTIARIDPSGDPRKLIVEQRPVYDWVGIEGQARSLGPGQKMTLRGFARGPVGYYIAHAAEGMMHAEVMTRFDAINTADVTHRYSLLAADPERPWLPRRGEDGGYVPLDPAIATVNYQSGVIKVGKGNNPKTLAVGMLSVGCVAETDEGTCDPEQLGVHVATYPLAFESRRTFKPVVVTPPRVQQRAASAGAALPPPPQAPPAGTAVQPLDLPPPPNAPALPPIDVPQVNPPSPPVPPPPPLQQSPVPLDLSASAPGVTIAPQTTVIPPPAPPIQPAPPGGARREARQRQSATQSSGSGADTGKSEIADAGGDKVDGPSGPGFAATRLDQRRAEGGSMTALYGGGITLLALVAAFGWNYNRPGPRRHSRIEPAPGWSRTWSRRRW